MVDEDWRIFVVGLFIIWLLNFVDFFVVLCEKSRIIWRNLGKRLGFEVELLWNGII